MRTGQPAPGIGVPPAPHDHGNGRRCDGGRIDLAQPATIAAEAIRVQVPEVIMHDLDAFQKVHASILDQVDCPGCTSGVQFIWQNYENLVVDGVGNVSPVANGAAVNILPEGDVPAPRPRRRLSGGRHHAPGGQRRAGIRAIGARTRRGALG